MYFKQFLHNETGCASYFIASRQTREAVVVDPQYEIAPYMDLAAERGYSICHVIDTHIHADHVSGNRRLAHATGAKLWLHALAEVEFPYHSLQDGDQLQMGQLTLMVVHTPGHRPEAICLLVRNLERSPEPSMLLSGDSLFVGDVGRPDFGGPEGAAEQFRSTRRLLELADWVEVFPAHFEGTCGKSMCGRPSTTIGFERRFNPMLQHDEATFVRVAAEPSPRPLNMTAIVATNQGRAEYGSLQASDATRVESIRAESAPQWIEQNGACVVDVREPWEYATGHIRDAMSMPQADLAVELSRLNAERSILVVCQSGMRSLAAAEFLKARGFDHVVNLSGGMLAWTQTANEVLT